MLHRLAICVILICSSLATPRSAVAGEVAIQAVFDTVDFVEIKNQDGCSSCVSQSIVIVRGIAAGASAPITVSFNFGTNADMATRCERLGVLAMSKPGKFQFSIGADTFNPQGHGHCKLLAVTP
jgi:hypothetical protein